MLTVEEYVKGLGPEMVLFTSHALQRFLWILKTIMEFHFLEIQAIFSDQKLKKRKPSQTKKPPKSKNSVRMFLSNLEDHISPGLALEAVKFSVEVFFF